MHRNKNPSPTENEVSKDAVHLLLGVSGRSSRWALGLPVELHEIGPLM